jgi:hypothetical protein
MTAVAGSTVGIGGTVTSPAPMLLRDDRRVAEADRRVWPTVPAVHVPVVPVVVLPSVPVVPVVPVVVLAPLVAATPSACVAMAATVRRVPILPHTEQ